MKDEYFKKLAIRANQRAKLLVARSDFQEDAVSLRKRFNIPQSGFKDENSNRKWHNKFYKNEDEYFETVWRKRSPEIGKLKKAKKFREAEDLQKILNAASPINSFRIAIKKILEKYKLPLRWEESVRRYLLFNDIDHMWLPGGITIRGERDKDTDMETLWIGIEDDTRIKDVEKAWSSIKFQQKQLHSYTGKKFQPIKNFDRDQEAYRLRKLGKSYSEIADTLSEKYDKVYSYDDVATFLKRHKRRTGIN